MHSHRLSPRYHSGFSLTELSVVLVIVALLLGGLMVPFGSQRDVESIRATEKSLVDIREALIGFAAINGRLPCPAQANIPSGNANAGLEATTTINDATSGNPITYCACSSTVVTSTPTTTTGTAGIGNTPCVAQNAQSSTDSVSGVVPWATLGLLETDAWGSRYTYQVNNFFARGINPDETIFGCTPLTTPVTRSSFALCSPSATPPPTPPPQRPGIAVITAAGGTTTLATLVPAIVVSHGISRQGGYNSQGLQLSVDADGSDANENAKRAAKRENSNGNSTFVSNTIIDDRLIWIPPGLLMSRMMAAGRLP